MIPAAALRWLPWAALAALVLAIAWVLHTAWRRGARSRPLLLGALVISAVPALLSALDWTGLLASDRLRLARPWASVVALAAVSFVVFRLLRLPARLGPARRRLADVLVPLAAFAAALAAGGPELGRPLDKLTVLVVVDRSRSIELVPNADKRITRELTVAELGMKDDDLLGTVAFAAEAATEDPPRPKSQLPAPQRVTLGRDGTDLAAAIRRALAEVPPDSAARVVLVSDGVATRGDTLSAAAAAMASQVPVDVLPLEQRQVPDVRLTAVRAPTRADEGEAMDLRVVTSSPAPAEIEIRIKRDGELISRATAKVAAGEDLLRIREKAPAPGLHRYDVEITALDPALDQAPEDNSGSAFVRVRGAARALVLDGDPGKSAFVAKALADAAFQVEEGGTARVPADIGALAAWDLVVLGDVRAADLAPTQIDALASYVRDLGGGLLLLGGDRSFGPGGYSRTPLEEVSPVSFDLKQERRRASLAEVIGIDISGSMAMEVSGKTKLELANEAAARSASLLGAGDRLGVEHVDTAVQWSVPLGPVVDKAAIEKAIRAVGPGGGGILVDITLQAAYAELDKEKVNLKHVLLFADGDDAENMGPAVQNMVADALRRGVTTSVVSLGRGSDVAELEVLSRNGGGRFYLIEDATRLPAVFAQETILAARSAIVEKDFRVERALPSSILAGVAVDDAPPLRGYVVTIPKGRATVLLTGIERDPILAVWSAGIGRAAAFTSDLKDRWGVAWTQWPGASKMVAQIGRDLARKGDDARVRLESDASGGQLSVRATVVGDDGRAQSFRRLVVHVAGPDGFAREVALEAVGAGAYAATVPLSRPGTYVAVARDELSGEAVGTTGAALGAGEELRPTGSDLALLTRIAELTGGKRRDTLAGIFTDRAVRRFAYRGITAELLVLAAAAMLLAVAARRLAMPEALAALPGRLFARRPAGAPAEPAARPEETMASLLGARERARAQSPAEPVRLPPPPPPGTWTPPRVPPPAAAPLPSGARGPTPSDASDAPPPSRRPLTAAEILLARRRGRGP
ncbi:MAG: VWA domain-containing protein [Polyangiaceae bacterium]